jgi:hypothetical protein
MAVGSNLRGGWGETPKIHFYCSFVNKFFSKSGGGGVNIENLKGESQAPTAMYVHPSFDSKEEEEEE